MKLTGNDPFGHGDRLRESIDQVRHGGLSEANHGGWEHLRDTSDLGRHHEQSARGGLQQSDAERFCERAVEEDVASDKHV